jgi:hypothetical protein
MIKYLAKVKKLFRVGGNGILATTLGRPKLTPTAHPTAPL